MALGAPALPSGSPKRKKATSDETIAECNSDRGGLPGKPHVSSTSASDQGILLRRTLPKSTDACQGACTTPGFFGVENLAELHQFFVDMADMVVLPFEPGPLARQNSNHGQLPDDIAVVDRLWELRLCIEMLHETLDAYDANVEQDPLSTPEETLSAIEGILRRVVELSFAHGLAREDASRRPSVANDALLLEIVRSDDFQRGHLTHCLLKSKLRISGLLEGALGELTEWQSRPREAELRMWKRWDRSYERVACKVADNAMLIKGPSSQRDQCCTEDSRCPPQIVECTGVRPARCPSALFPCAGSSQVKA